MKKVSPLIIPKEFTDFIYTSEFEDDGGILIQSIALKTDNINLELVLHSGNEDVQNQIWEIHLSGVREEKIVLEYSYKIDIYSDHLLLKPYSEIHGELYIKEKARNPYQLLTELYLYHKKEFGNFLEIEKVFNSGKKLDEICCMSHGLVAKGPYSYLKKYFELFEKHGTKPYLFGNYKPKRWTKENWVDEKENLKLLFCGKSFFIAEEIKFKKTK
jgi:hypothetical protein